MPLFGKKKIDSSVNFPSVFTMPAEFYGGKNPVVQFKQVLKEVKVKEQNNLTASEKKLLDKSTAVGASSKFHPARLLSSGKFLMISLVILLVILLGVAGWYYWYSSKKSQPTVMPTAPVIDSQPVEVAPVTPVDNIVPEVAPVVDNTPSINSEPPLDLPSMLLGDSADMDRDDISDLAEETFKTDPAIPDTDNDKFIDGSEVYNLFSPIAPAGAKLIDSGLVKDFSNPVSGYQVYYPADWAIGNVDQNFRQVLFSTLTGENIEIRTFDLFTGQSFADWFAKWAQQDRYNFNELERFTSVFKVEGWRRKDNLVYYFIDGQRVYVISYHTTDSPVVNYRIVMKMMARSFRFGANIITSTTPFTEDLPPRIEEGLDMATSTGANVINSSTTGTATSSGII